MFKRTAGVSCSQKESIDGLEIIVCKLEMVQRRAARYVQNNYHNTSSVTSMIGTLGWPTLAELRLKTRLIMLYKITHACDFLVLLSVGMSMLFGIAIKACVILYNMINLVLRRRSAKVGQP
jgi:hypothetical protein